MIEEQNLTDRQRQLIRFFHQNTFAEHMRAEPVLEDNGRFHLELTVEEHHTNLYNIVHGGVLMTLADTAMGAACLACNKKVVTVSLTTNFLHAVPLTTKVITTAKVLHDGRHTMTCECELKSEEGKIFAKAQGTFYVLGKFVEEGGEEE